MHQIWKQATGSTKVWAKQFPQITTTNKYSTQEKTYDNAIRLLNSFQTNYATIQQTRISGNKNYDTLKQMVEYSRRIGYEPEQYDRLNLIHVTGTKGKGSTCAFIQSMLLERRTKKLSKVGLYTSPHLKSVNERICLDGEPVSKELFSKYFFEVYESLLQTNDNETLTTELTKNQKPSYFKFLTLLAFHTFMREKVDAAIFEVGVGGELDSTNIIVQPLVCGVTSIALDHTFVLGDTLEKIAWNKSGIFKKYASAYSVEQKPQVLEVLFDRAAEKQCDLKVIEINPDLQNLKLGIDGDVQKLNASLAVAMTNQFLNLRQIQEEPITKVGAKIKRGLEKARLPGRAQTLPDPVNKKITWFIDGSHTEESINHAANWFRKTAEKRQETCKVLIFNQQSRDIEKLVQELYSVLNPSVKFHTAIFSSNVTWNDQTYDMNLVSINVDETKVNKLEIQNIAKNKWSDLEKNDQHTTNTMTSENIESSIDYVRKLQKETRGEVDVFVCGSLHLAGGVLVVLDGPKNFHDFEFS